MVGRYCAVALCYNSYGKTKKDGLGITYHSFPVDPKVRKLWVGKCKRMDSFNPNSSYICSAHFDADDFERDLKSELLGLPLRRSLKKGVIPHFKIPKSGSGFKIRTTKCLEISKEQHDENLAQALQQSQALLDIKSEPIFEEAGPSGIQPPKVDFEALYLDCKEQLVLLNDKFKNEQQQRKAAELKSKVFKKKFLEEKRKSESGRVEIKKIAKQNLSLKIKMKQLQKHIKTISSNKDSKEKILNLFTENERKIISQDGC